MRLHGVDAACMDQPQDVIGSFEYVKSVCVVTIGQSNEEDDTQLKSSQLHVDCKLRMRTNLS